MDANVKKVFEESPWFLATCGDEPHVVPVGFKTITEDGKFAIGAVLAGIGAILYCCKYPQVKPTTGYLLGMKAFVAAVLGGIGSIPGAMLGGLAIGMAEVIVNALGYTTWADAVVYVILIIVLLVKPTGFLGRTMREKV